MLTFPQNSPFCRHLFIFVDINRFVADNKSTTLLGLELTWFVLISVSCFLAVGAVLAGLVICICRHNPNSSDNQMQCKSTNRPNFTYHIHWGELVANRQFCDSNLLKFSHRYEWINEIYA